MLHSPALHSRRTWLRSIASTLLITLSLGAFGALRAADDALCVMTYNLRVPMDKTPNTWPERRAAVAECIRMIAPDLMGTQEGIKEQLDDVATDLPGYTRLGQGREGGDKGEYSAIFYRSDRFEVLDHGDFWLSDTPEIVGSRTWGHKLPRMVTWAKLRDKIADREFVWFNTHFDHQSQPAREKSAALLCERAKALDPKLPVIITGDFNAAGGENRAYKILVQPERFTDTWFAAAERMGEGLNSFNGFASAPVQNGKRIDWVLFRGNAEVSKAAIVTFQKQEGHFPSDHCPVVAWMRFLPASEAQPPAAASQ
ncbi:endonuclease/exonuclease/phosphatase family protein [Verrucomicrobiota bacterium sgz303538]